MIGQGDAREIAALVEAQRRANEEQQRASRAGNVSEALAWQAKAKQLGQQIVDARNGRGSR